MNRIGWERVRVAAAAAVVIVGLGAAAHAADLEVYKSHEIEPYKPAQEVKPAPPAPQPAPQPDPAPDHQPAPSHPQPPQPTPTHSHDKAPAPPAVTTGNLVEPLSNGLKLTMTMRDIQTQFGPPTDQTFDARTFGYPGFGVQCGGPKASIWRATIKGDTKLHCGLGAGSTRADVQRLLGSPVGGTVGQYDLTVSYGRDGAVEAIKIEPANGDFAPYEGSTPTPSVDAKKPDLTGAWWGDNGLLGRIDLAADGSWSSPNGAKGTYAVDGDTVTFTGPLAAWNDGRATLKDGRLQFAWTNADGSRNAFSFSKR